MGKRKAEDEKWELVKDEIIDLYANHPLHEVIDIMNGKGFLRTKNQYWERLKKWRDPASQKTVKKIRTNITDQEWKSIVKRIDERQEMGKSSLVTVRGVEVPQSKIKKQGKLHSYKTALENLTPKIRLPQAPNVVVSTPPERSPVDSPANSVEENTSTADGTAKRGQKPKNAVREGAQVEGGPKSEKVQAITSETASTSGMYDPIRDL